MYWQPVTPWGTHVVVVQRATKHAAASSLGRSAASILSPIPSIARFMISPCCTGPPGPGRTLRGQYARPRYLPVSSCLPVRYLLANRALTGRLNRGQEDAKVVPCCSSL